MRVILHVGMPKTGSSALQSSLSLNRRVLLKNGILYPKLSVNPTNHNILSLLERSGQQAPRHFMSWHKLYGINLGELLEDSLGEIRAQVERYKPEILIISSENLFSAFENSLCDSLANFFSSVGISRKDVFPVVYVRQPSKRFASAAQQRLRASSRVPSLKVASVIPNINNLERAFTRPAVRAFERDSLIGQDIFTDFSLKFLPFKDLNSFKRLSGAVNESLSSEVISILQEYSVGWHLANDDLFTADREYLLRVLPRLEGKYNLFSRPVLRKEIEEALDYSDSDLEWLLSNFGVRFKFIDYSRVGLGKRLEMSEGLRVHQVFEVDQEKKNKILILFLGELVNRRINYKLVFWAFYRFRFLRKFIAVVFSFGSRWRGRVNSFSAARRKF